ncbi:YciI family protein [Actinokineospora enzanensis]|uniref:YciI family protein n=1 Tax=Actinokineospora enzanensis TaxID=155975 RepID=UPI0003709F60|nr:YciI family protein [Actinokineospora enzanensis]
MAQYLISVLTDAPVEGNAEEAAAIDVFNAQLQADGQWVFAGGLAWPDSATVVDGRGAEPVFTDGPYAESKEHVIGFWIVEAPHLDVALRLAGQGSKACNRRVEVRPFLSE